MHGVGQWLLVPAVLLVVVAYVCGRRGSGWAAVGLLCAVEALSALAAAIGHDTASWLTDQVVVVLATVAALSGAYRRLRHEFAERGWARARDTRARIAADLHDALGHDLTLLSLRAAGIQVTAADPAVREQAAALRAGAASAVETVRRIATLLDTEPESDVAAVVDRARAAGMTVDVTGLPPADGFTARLITEALSNAARHAPGAPVTIAFGRHRVEVRNPTTPAAGVSAAGSGLAVLAARLAEAGGSLTAGLGEGLWRVVADVPPGVDGDSGPLDADYTAGRRRVRRMFAVALLVPTAAVVVPATGFYAWATAGTTVEQPVYARLRVGMPEERAVALLPRSEAHLRFGAGNDPGCRYYTDGNYPLAYATYEICFRGGRLASLHDGTGRQR